MGGQDRDGGASDREVGDGTAGISGVEGIAMTCGFVGVVVAEGCGSLEDEVRCRERKDKREINAEFREHVDG